MTEIRVDKTTLPSVKRTDEGYLRGEAVVTRTGVFKYVNADGTIRAELRHPDDVMSTDSLATLSMLPVTNEHPKVLVTSENARELSVGFTGERPRVDGRHILTTLTVTDGDSIKQVQSGQKAELSLGYRVDVVEEAGTWEGEAYTHRQRNVRYNHLALVPQARAGRAARLNLDGETVLVEATPQAQGKPMNTVHIDGVTYEAPPQVVIALNKVTADAAAARTDAATAATKLAEALTRADTAEAQRDAAKAAQEAAEAALTDTTKLDAAVAARIELVAKALKLAPKVKLDGLKSDREIMVAAITGKVASFKADGKTDDYVAARFDAELDGLPKQADQLATGTRGDGRTVVDLNTARADAMAAIAAQNKGA